MGEAPDLTNRALQELGCLGRLLLHNHRSMVNDHHFLPGQGDCLEFGSSTLAALFFLFSSGRVGPSGVP